MRAERVKLATPVLSLVQCTNASVWDDFVRRSPQGAVFCQTAFLDALPVAHELWQVVDGHGHVQLGVVLLRDEQGRVVRQPYDFSLYQGILLDGALAAMPVHRAVPRELSAVNFLLAELAAREERLSFCLHHTWQDMRAFNWFNYHVPSAGQFCVTVRQTGLIALAGLTFNSYLEGIRKSRRQEWRLARLQGFTVAPSDDIAAFLNLYQQTFSRQGINPSASALRLVGSITAAALTGRFGELLLTRGEGGEPVSATVFLCDQSCSYYLFGATDPRFRAAGAGVATVLESLRRCFEQSVTRVDVGGINSPQRGDFKISFNAQPTPFYVVNYTRGH
ncbi:MAG: GNAT family N-acetyltransferase [Candidatus Andersenbacteria bacterium]|nr:GNAT family N-acetyltransferase [Candidatus Andersenbacteria bacterium]